MIGTLWLDRVRGVKVNSAVLSPTRMSGGADIPGGRSLYGNLGVGPETLSLEGFIDKETYPDPDQAWLQLQEIFDNPGMEVGYLEFPEPNVDYRGWYVLDSLALGWFRPRCKYLFTLGAHRVGIKSSSHRQAMLWDAATEEFTTFTSLEANSRIGLPYGALYTAGGGAPTTIAIAEGGTLGFLRDPTPQTLPFTPAANLGDWYKGECGVWDTVHPGATDETEWLRVYSPRHVFTGDTVLQNGILRYHLNSSGESDLYFWNTLTAPDAWMHMGQLLSKLDGPLTTTIRAVEILYLNPDYVSWRELRQSTNYAEQLTFLLRRGCQHLKVNLKTSDKAKATNSFVTLYDRGAAAGYFASYFNSGASGNAGGGDLAVANDHNYYVGYNTTRKVLIGFCAFDQPAKMPYDDGAAGHSLRESNTWTTEDEHSFAIWAGEYDTTGFVIANARAVAHAIMKDCNMNVVQKLILVPSGFYGF